MGAHDWPRVEKILFQLHDEPRRVRAVLETFSAFTIRLIERILRDVEVDFVSFSEPIGGNDRPLLSPKTYQECVLASYRPIIETLKRHGVETIVFQTYVNARVLLPGVVAAGFNGLWACESQPKSDGLPGYPEGVRQRPAAHRWDRSGHFTAGEGGDPARAEGESASAACRRGIHPAGGWPGAGRHPFPALP